MIDIKQQPLINEIEELKEKNFREFEDKKFNELLQEAKEEAASLPDGHLKYSLRELFEAMKVNLK